MALLPYLNAIRGTGNYTEQQKPSGVFLFLVQTNFFCWNSEQNGKGLAGEVSSYIVFYPSLRKSPIKKYAADNQHDPASLFFNQHQTRYIKRVYWNHHKSFALIYREIKTRFDIYGTKYFKSVIKGFKFVFSDLFFLQIKLLLYNKNNLKNWMPLQYLKKVSNETEESKGLRPTIQKDEKSALFCNSVNSVISSSKFSFK